MPDPIDVAIVGGGAAGIAAARGLVQHGRSVLLIEALPRLGGRAHSVTADGMAIDLGCGWLHSAARNPLAALAAETGAIVDRRESAWRKQLRDRNISAAEQRRSWQAYEGFLERLHRDPPASDCAADALPAEDRWRYFIDGLSSFVNGTELDRLSVADFLAYEDAATDENWRLPSGMGNFIAGLAAGVPAALSTAVTAIGQDGTGMTLQTDRGPLRAQAAIVAVSSAVLASGAIRFAPAVDDHLHAAAHLPLGLADKIILAMAEPHAVPAESHLLGRFDRAATGSYYLRPFGRPQVECFLGGRQARALEDAGEAAAIAFVRDELRDLLGADFARGLTPVAVTRWAHEPTILGSYSHALPGHAGARAVLARPVSERLCFAGEACSAQDFSTAHGAWQSGIAAANWIERHLPA